MEILTKFRTQLTLKNVLDNLDPKLTSTFLPWALRHPRYLRTFIRLIHAHKHTKLLRENAKSNGLSVPPFLILSITSRCNLHCVGCYATAAGITHHEKLETHKRMIRPLKREEWRTIITQAGKLGVLGFVIAGGEPFLFPRLLELCDEFKNRFFLILTNGTAITEADFERLKHMSNIAVIMSIEGGQEATDARRGQGAYEKNLDTLQRLNKIGVLTGISVTINRLNYVYWMNPEHLDHLIDQGVHIGVFIEYIPLTPLLEPKSSKQQPSFFLGLPDEADKWTAKDDHTLMLTKEERAKFRSQILNYRATKPIYLIHSPGDEEFFGGCVSAGRGFAHVTPTGDLTPCPVSNLATHNLMTATLREGLASPLFTKIRASDHLLENGDTPCALFAHPKEVAILAKAVGAYRTDHIEL